LFYLSDKTSELELCRIAEIFCSSSLKQNLKPKSFTRQLAACTALLAGAVAAGEQTADHGGSESGEADQQQLNPPASRQRQRPGAQALTRVLPSSSE
jgi:hypothetical protein